MGYSPGSCAFILWKGTLKWLISQHSPYELFNFFSCDFWEVVDAGPHICLHQRFNRGGCWRYFWCRYCGLNRTNHVLNTMQKKHGVGLNPHDCLWWKQFKTQYWTFERTADTTSNFSLSPCWNSTQNLEIRVHYVFSQPKRRGKQQKVNWFALANSNLFALHSKYDPRPLKNGYHFAGSE